MPPSRPWTRFAGLAVATAAALFLLVSNAAGGLEEQWRQVRDGLFERSASGQIVLVEIDAKSLTTLGEWPWPRRLHAQMIDRLNALGSETIAFDVDFSARSNSVDDAVMATSLERSKGSVILPTFRQPASTGSAAFTENLPIEPFRAHALLASVNVSPERNGQIARYGYGVVTNGTPRPSLAAMMAGSSGRMNSVYRIDTAIDPTTIPRVSAVDLLAGRVDPTLVRGKTAIVGATAIELGDRYATPRHGVIPGVLIQILAAETLSQGRQAPLVNPIVAVLAALLAIALIARICGASTQTFARGATFVAFLAAPILLEWLGLSAIAIMPALIVLGVEWTFASISRFAARIRNERLTDLSTGLPNARAFDRDNLGKPQLTVIVVRFTWFEEMDAHLDDRTRALWTQRTLDRLTLGLPHQKFYTLAPGVMAWSEPGLQSGVLVDRIESTSALFRAPLQLGDRTILMTPNFGISSGEGRATRKLVAQAMIAARHSQETGHSCSIHSDRTSDEAQRALTLLADVEGALTSGEIFVAYQPKWSISEDRLYGAEALVRWNHPTLGFISPDDFIPLLESSGNMAALTLAVVDMSLKDLKSWHDAGVAISVAVNISAALLDDAPFVDALNARLGVVGMLMPFVTLEVTESAAVNHTDDAVTILTALRARGVRISIDDYGTGRATLAYLKAFPADEVKIDKSFVTNLLVSVSDQILVRSTIELASELNFKVVAEGVEDGECLAKLAEFGCDIAQGWHIGKPIAAQAFWERWIENHGTLAKNTGRVTHIFLSAGGVLTIVLPWH